MPSCDMCGNNRKLVRALIEGTELNVCSECAKFGKTLKIPVLFIQKKKPVRTEQPEALEFIVPNYNSLIKKKREEIGIKQEELAQKLAEKESIIQKVESGQMEPSIALAKKIEIFFNIKLIEKFDSKEGSMSTKSRTAEFTIGDIIKKK